MKPFLLFSLFSFLNFVSNAQTPVLLKDFWPTTKGGVIQQYASTDQQVFFVIADELWVSDLTTANTQLVKKFSSSDFYGLTNLANVLYFIHGNKLWKSDGTGAGTRIVGGGYTIPNIEKTLTVFNDQLAFVAEDVVHGAELWISDGTDQGTRMLADIDKGNTSSIFITRAVMNNKLYFSEDDTSDLNNLFYDLKLWETDGSTYFSRITDTSVYSIAAYSDILYYFGISHGQQSGPFCIHNLKNGAIQHIDDRLIEIKDYEIVSDKIVFVIGDLDFNDKLYSVDTFGHNFTRLNDTASFDQLNSPVLPNAKWMTRVGNQIYVLQRLGADYELWTTDGTKGGTHKVVLPPHLLLRANISSMDGKLFFKAYDSISKRAEVFYLDALGNAIPMIYPSAYQYNTQSAIIKRAGGAGALFPFKHHLIFTNDYDSAIGNKLYMLDFTPASVQGHVIGQVAVFPNPAADYINISGTNIRDAIILDNAGRKIVTADENRISVKHLAPGIYTIHVRLEDGGRKYAKFIKQ